MKIKLLLIFLISSIILQAQTTQVVGTVTDAEIGEPLIAVNIVSGQKGATTDIDGQYTIELPNGTHQITFSYVGYESLVKEVKLIGGTYELNVAMGGVASLKEITVTADIAVERKTPVAFSNVPTVKLNEELASQDLPMILNTTPGAYATQSGGGDGDARVTIRGFNQRNVAVMLDGIPVNDMENGWVYWSNWFGLDLVTKTMQVQRGLGASKLALPSVGGTINILTKGIEAKRSVRFRQEVGNDGYLRSTFGLTSGRLENGFGISVAGSYKVGNGWVDQTFTEGYFYYLRIDKEIGKHLISLSGFGAPQRHGQRSFTAPIALYDTEYARSLGVSDEAIDVLPRSNLGRRYNQHWGYYNGEELNTRQNYYHKPQYSLRHSWNASNRFYLSNVAYVSIGNGGGVGPNDGPDFADDNQLDLQTIYDVNTTTSIFKPDLRSDNFLRASVNNHFWYGVLSTFKYDFNQNLSLSGGVDLRNYQGDHYRVIHDLMGGEYARSEGNYRIDESTAQLKQGDKFVYDNTGFVQWGGLFGLLEYSNNKLSTFINISAAQTGYSLEDYMKPMEVNLADTLFYVSYDNPVVYNDVTYTVESAEAQNQRIDWIWQPSFTFKTGASYEIDEKNSVFVNTGYLSRAPRFTNVIIDNRFNQFPIQPFGNMENEKVLAVELGYTFKSSFLTSHINLYRTAWNNKPLDRAPTVLEDPSDPDSDRIPVNVSGIAALHQGIEVDFIYKVNPQLNIEGLASFGDWRWNSSASTLLPDGVTTYEFDATGVHVGDAAQTQIGGLIRYEPIRGLYIKAKTTYFARNFANFNPEDLKGATARRDSWQMPNYNLVDFHSGYNFKVKDIRMGVRFNVLNVLDATYISDANNNDRFTQSFNNFDAQSAAVFLGMGRRWNTSFQITF